MDLLLLAPYDIHNPLPTLFEVFALDELRNALRNALNVGLFNAVDRAANYVHPAAMHLQPLLPEIELAITLLIEGRFLQTFDATTCQRLFGLKLTKAVPRTPVITRSGGAREVIKTATDPRLPQSVAGVSFAPLSPQQRAVMLLEAALVPYLSRRLEALHAEFTDNTPEGRERRDQRERTAPGWQLRIMKLLVKVYPILRAVFGVTKAMAWLAYMSNRSPFPSVTTFLTKTVLTRRTSGDDALQRMSAGSNRLMMLLSGVITWTIVGFEVADWWWRDGGRSSVLRDRRALPPPPPPQQQPTPSSAGSADVAAAVEDGSCPICKSVVANPCVNIASGYVCCYPCLARHVREHGTDPVKPQLRTTARHIRRLFVTAE